MSSDIDVWLLFMFRVKSAFLVVILLSLIAVPFG